MKIPKKSQGLRGTRILRALQDSDALPIAPAPSPSAGDGTWLLDAYSRTIAVVVNRVAPSVVTIRVEGEHGGLH